MSSQYNRSKRSQVKADEAGEPAKALERKATPAVKRCSRYFWSVVKRNVASTSPAIALRSAATSSLPAAAVKSPAEPFTAKPLAGPVSA